jgi:hypothetical protein
MIFEREPFKEQIDEKDCLHTSWYYEPEYNKFGDLVSEGEKYCHDCGKRLN